MSQQLHVLITGPPGSGKTTLGRRLTSTFSASFLDVRNFYERGTRFTVSERTRAFAMYCDALVQALADGANVLSEGFFWSQGRRGAVASITATASSTFVPITLVASEASLLGRVRQRVTKHDSEVPESEIRRFCSNFRSDPWGLVVDTTHLAVEDVYLEILRHVKTSQANTS